MYYPAQFNRYFLKKLLVSLFVYPPISKIYSVRPKKKISTHSYFEYSNVLIYKVWSVQQFKMLIYLQILPSQMGLTQSDQYYTKMEIKLLNF